MNIDIFYTLPNNVGSNIFIRLSQNVRKIFCFGGLIALMGLTPYEGQWMSVVG